VSHINTTTVRHHSCQFLVAFMYMGGAIKHRL